MQLVLVSACCLPALRCVQVWSCGMMTVLILEPPACSDFAVAQQALLTSAAKLLAEEVTVTDLDTVLANAIRFMFKSGSADSCQVAIEPIRFTTGVEALRALCRFARPLARPGPRCSKVVAGSCLSRAYPSAAPVQTVSCIHKTARTADLFKPSTSHISVVPGFAKQTRKPASCTDFHSSSAGVISTSSARRSTNW